MTNLRLPFKDIGGGENLRARDGLVRRTSHVNTLGAKAGELHVVASFPMNSWWVDRAADFAVQFFANMASIGISGVVGYLLWKRRENRRFTLHMENVRRELHNRLVADIEGFVRQMHESKDISEVVPVVETWRDWLQVQQLASLGKNANLFGRWSNADMRSLTLYNQLGMPGLKDVLVADFRATTLPSEAA